MCDYYFVIELVFVGINLLLAAYQKRLIGQNIKIYHTMWAVLYAICIIPVWLIAKNPILCINVVLIREVVFSPFLNWLRDKPFFYVGLIGPNSSWLDKVEGKSNVVLYFVSLISLITFNIIQITNN